MQITNGLTFQPGFQVAEPATPGSPGGDLSFASVDLLLSASSGIVDLSGDTRPLSVIGNPVVSTTQAKFGTQSFNIQGGTTSRIQTTTTAADQTFEVGDFTIEFWFYLNVLANGAAFFVSTAIENQAWVQNDMFFIQLSGSPWRVRLLSHKAAASGFVLGETNQFGPASLATGQWYHYAAVREGTEYRQYIDGVLSSTDTFADSIMDGNPGFWQIGGTGDTSYPSINGFLDQFRITKGVARYSATFTPPTAPYSTS